MKHLYDEVLHRFPEIEPSLFEGDEELPYLFFTIIADWLKTVAKPQFSQATIQRVIDFDNWCMAQPRGESADDDIMTIHVVAFREKLFEHDDLLPLIPHLMDRQEILQNKDYLVGWIGQDRYQTALRMFDSKKQKGGQHHDPRHRKNR